MAEKKKPKPGPSTGGSSTSRIKKPRGTQPLTLGVGGIRTSKVSKKQMAGTRKVVGAIATAIPIGRAASVAARAASKASGARVQNKLNKYASADVRAGRVDPDWATHPVNISYKGSQRVMNPKAKFPTARQSVRWRKAEEKVEKRALKSVNTKKYTKKYTKKK